MSLEPPHAVMQDPGLSPNTKRWISELYKQFNTETKVKLADESVTSSTTLQNDNELLLSLAANSTYEIQAQLLATSASATPDIKYSFNEADGTWYAVSFAARTNGGAGTEFGISPSVSAVAALAGSSVVSLIIIKGIAVTGSSGGVFALEWAQDTSNATATTILANSWMSGRKL